MAVEFENGSSHRCSVSRPCQGYRCRGPGDRSPGKGPGTPGPWRLGASPGGLGAREQSLILYESDAPAGGWWRDGSIVNKPERNSLHPTFGIRNL